MKHNQSLAEKQTESTFITNKERKEAKSFLFAQQNEEKNKIEKFRNTNPNIIKKYDDGKMLSSEKDKLSYQKS